MATIKWTRHRQVEGTNYAAKTDRAWVRIWKGWDCFCIEVSSLTGVVIRTDEANTLTEAKLIAEDNYL